MSAILSAKMALRDAMLEAQSDPVALGQLLAVLLSHTAIVRGMLDESASSSSSSAGTGGERGTPILGKR
jgi:hypothetical protein